MAHTRSAEELLQRQIEGSFEAPHLSNAPDREWYLRFDRFSDGADAAQDRRTETLRVVLRDGTIPSSLGPIDPQIAGLAPHGIEEFTGAHD